MASTTPSRSSSTNALLPLRLPAVAYTVSADGQPPNIPGTCIAIGLTATGATLNNFATVGQVWLSLRNERGGLFGGPLVFELRLDGKTGPLLATGVVEDLVFNRLAIRHDPAGLPRALGAVQFISHSRWAAC